MLKTGKLKTGKLKQKYTPNNMLKTKHANAYAKHANAYAKN